MENNENQTAVSGMNIQNISQPIYEAKFWLKLMGVFSILNGDAAALLETNKRLKTAITIMGVIQLLMLIASIASVVAVFGLGLGAAMMGSGLN